MGTRLGSSLKTVVERVEDPQAVLDVADEKDHIAYADFFTHLGVDNRKENLRRRAHGHTPGEASAPLQEVGRSIKLGNDQGGRDEESA